MSRRHPVTHAKVGRSWWAALARVESSRDFAMGPQALVARGYTLRRAAQDDGRQPWRDLRRTRSPRRFRRDRAAAMRGRRAARANR